MLVPQVRNWMQIWEQVLFCTPPGWRTAQQKVSKEWRQQCSGYAEKYTTIGLRMSRYGAAQVLIDFSEELKHTGANPLCPIHWSVLRHANIRDQNPSLGMICPGDLHQRNSIAPKFEDRSQEETEWQEQSAREAAGKLAKHILKLKEKHKTTFFSPSEKWCLPAPSTNKPEEREFVVDSGASMHMISKKDLNSVLNWKPWRHQEVRWRL